MASPRRRGWLRAAGLALAGLALLTVLTALAPVSTKELPGSVDNPGAQGTRAVAQVLGDGGVRVTQVTRLDDAIARAAADTTLAVWLTDALSATAYDRLNGVAADLVLIVPDGYTAGLEELTGGALRSTQVWGHNALAAACDEPDAVAAGRIEAGGGGLLALGGDLELCFTSTASSGLYADLAVAGHRVTVIASGPVFANSGITAEGHAALALRTLGRHATLTWYLPGDDAAPAADSGSGATVSTWDLLPPSFRAVFGLLVVAGFAAALWRGRRLGPLVPEPLPVAVPASEAAAGLGRLYRQAGARGHAAAGLRAGTAYRLGLKLGLPLSAPPAVVAERLGLATGRPTRDIQVLLYGPPPTSDAELVNLAHLLHQLESESSAR